MSRSYETCLTLGLICLISLQFGCGDTEHTQASSLDRAGEHVDARLGGMTGAADPIAESPVEENLRSSPPEENGPEDALTRPRAMADLGCRPQNNPSTMPATAREYAALVPCTDSGYRPSLAAMTLCVCQQPCMVKKSSRPSTHAIIRVC